MANPMLVEEEGYPVVGGPGSGGQRGALRVGINLDERGQGLDRILLQIDDEDAYTRSFATRWDGTASPFSPSTKTARNVA